MLEIRFYPDSDKQEFIEAAKEYQDIWDKEGQRIVETIERVGGLKFVEKFINALIYEGASFSFPPRLRASYTHEIKKSTLVHELCHRLLSGNEVGLHSKGPSKDPKSPETHKELYLILYDILVELYGEDFAKRNVKVESERDFKYKEGWDWALSLNKKTRQAKFAELVS